MVDGLCPLSNNHERWERSNADGEHSVRARGEGQQMGAFWNSLVGAFSGLFTAAAIGAGIVWFSQTALEKYMGTIAEKQAANYKLTLDRDLEQFKNHLDESLEAIKGRIGTEEAAQRLRFEKVLDFRSRQLSEFYWPIYIRLQKDNAVWERVLGGSADRFSEEIGTDIEKNVLLPNHDEIVQIIQTKYYLAEKDDVLEAALLKYIRHIAVYHALRSTKEKKNPIDLNEPYPSEFYPLFKARLEDVQRKYEELLKRSTDLD